MCTATLAILNAYFSSYAALSMCFLCTAINNIAFVPPERGTCVFIQRSNLNSICLWLDSLWKHCTPENSQDFQELHFQFHPSHIQRLFFFFSPLTAELVFGFFDCHNPSVFPALIFLVDVGKYGHSPTSDCSENLNYDLPGQGGNPALFVTMNLSLGNIARLWRIFPVCIFPLMHY